MDENDSPQEIDIDALLRTPERHEFRTYNPQMKTLPFDQVPWERISNAGNTATETRVFGSRLIQAFGYGSSGYAQYGIDVIALKPGPLK